MSIKTVVERVQEAIESFLPSFEKLTLSDIGVFSEKVKVLSEIFPGIDPQALISNVHIHAKESAASYFKILDEAPRRASVEPSEIRDHLRKCAEVLNKFDKLLSITKGDKKPAPQPEALKAPIIHIPSKITEIESSLGKNFHGEDFWKKLGISLTTPDLSQYPMLTKKFLDGAFEYNPEMKRSEAGVLYISAPDQSFNSFIKLSAEYCESQGKNPAFFGTDWRQEEEFANTKHSAEEFHFIFKDIAPESTSLTFDAQVKLKQPGFLVTGAKELAEAVCIHYIDSDERIYKPYGRTRDVDGDGLRIVVGCSFANGARIDSNQDDTSFENVGISFCWNLKQTA